MFWLKALSAGLFAVLSFSSAILAGAVATPLLLPWLPGRAFAFKGMVMGLVAAFILSIAHIGNFGTWSARLEVFAWFLLTPAVAGYLAMNFTGSSTYTSLSGVKKEMKWAVPIEIGAGGVGLVLLLSSRFLA